jgi:Family of unknown function (DUF5372)
MLGCKVCCSRIRSQVTSFNDLAIAPGAREGNRQLRITHPFHPLKGKQFELVEYRCIFTERYVYFHDDCGQLREIPAAWTDFVKADVFVEIASSRSPLHAGTLLELADLVERMARELSDGV